MNIENNEKLSDEPTVIEVIESCKDVLGEELCDDLAKLDDMTEVLSLVYSVLLDKGIDPVEFLKSIDVIE